jgi:hypothetical protein
MFGHEEVRCNSVAPLSHLFAGSTLDAEGKRVALMPPLPVSEKERDEAIFAHVVAHMSTQRLCSVHGAIFPAFKQLVSEHVIALQEMEALAAYSPFVPPGRERIFSQGLYAGFSQDFLTALHLLVPQIENSLRHLMQNRDIITTKPAVGTSCANKTDAPKADVHKKEWKSKRSLNTWTKRAAKTLTFRSA